MRRRWFLAVAAMVVAAVLAACGPSFGPGPTGKVADKRSRLSCQVVGAQRNCHWRYWLTTSSEFRVDGDVYRACVRGSVYPKCAGVEPRRP